MKFLQPIQLTVSISARRFELQPGQLAPEPDGMLDRLTQCLDQLPLLMDLCLVGNDAIASPRLPEIVKECSARSIALSVDTWCQVETDSISTSTLANISQVRVYLLSSCAEKNDSIVGSRGHFARVLTWLAYLKSSGVKSIVLVIPLLESNSEEIESFIQIAQELGCRLNLFPVPLSAGGVDALTRRSFWFCSELFQQLDTVYPRVMLWSSMLGPKNNNYSCPALCGIQLHLDLKSGKVFPCRWSQQQIGCFDREPLIQIYARWRLATDQNRPAGCCSCKDWERCLGGCLGNRQTLDCRDAYCERTKDMTC